MGAVWRDGPPPAFDAPGLARRLDAAPLDAFDALDFGLITVDGDDAVVGYNAFESRRAGFSPERFLGRDLFLTVAPCTNNYLVAERYWHCRRAGEDLDEQLDYVFTFRMRATPVRLRLLATAGAGRSYLAVRPR